MATDITRHKGNRQIFNDAASYYQTLRWFKTRLTRFEFDLTRTVLLEDLAPNPGAKALEVGCGPGTWTREVAPLVEHLTALDISEEMIEQARAYTGADNVDFVHSDIAQYPLDRQFDAVFSVRVVEYLDQWEPVISRLLDAVAAGGRAAIITKTPISVWRGTGRERAVAQTVRRIGRKIRGIPEPERAPFWQRYIPPAGLAQMFEEHGLRNVRIRPVIYGLPIFVRGTKQYPLIPEALEPAVLNVFRFAWRIADHLPPSLRTGALVFSESYSVSGTRPVTAGD